MGVVVGFLFNYSLLGVFKEEFEGNWVRFVEGLGSYAKKVKCFGEVRDGGFWFF